MNILIIGLAIFVITVSCIELLLYARRTYIQPDRQKIRKRVRHLASGQFEMTSSGILRKEKFSDIPWLHMILSRAPGIKDLEKLRKQANAKSPLGLFILLSLFLAVMGFFIFSQLILSPMLSLLIAIISLASPWIYLQNKKKSRMKKFQRQLPEALDLIARSLRAGHAFTSGLKLTADQFDDPLGTEFQETIDEINFGISISEALKNLANRIDCPDLQFFVVSVILQRETGGNLAEIMENSARLIRERFKFHKHVKALAAEGKMSGIILVALPIFLFFVLYIINPEYVSLLLTEKVGNVILGAGGLMMLMGVAVINKLIKIKA